MSWQPLAAPPDRYTSVAFAPDGTVLIAGTRGGAVRWWVVADGTPIRQPMQGNAPITSGALDLAGDLVAAGRVDGEVWLWHSGVGWPTRLVPGTGQAIRGVAFAPDSQRLLIWDAASVSIWNPVRGLAYWTTRELPGGVAQAAWGLDGTWVATAGAGGPVSLWQGADGRLLRRWEGTAEPVVAVGGGGQVLAFTVAPDQVEVWRVPEGARLYALRGLPGVIRSLACTAWGSVLAVGTSTGAVALSTDDGPHIVEGLPGAVRGLAFTPSTGRLVTVTEEGTVTTWAAPAGPLLRRLDSWPLPAPGDRVQQVAFAPARRAVAVVTEDAAVWLWRDPSPPDAIALSAPAPSW